MQVLGDDLVAVAPIGHKRVVALGRRGGPAYLDSELARLRHLVALAASIARPRGRGPDLPCFIM